MPCARSARAMGRHSGPSTRNPPSTTSWRRDSREPAHGHQLKIGHSPQRQPDTSRSRNIEASGVTSTAPLAPGTGLDFQARPIARQAVLGGDRVIGVHERILGAFGVTRVRYELIEVSATVRYDLPCAAT